MPLLAQICLVVATLSVAAIAVAIVRVMARVEKAADQFTQLTAETQQWIAQVKEGTREAGEAVASVRAIIPPIRRVAERFGILGDRTADLSSAMLEEVEPPLRTALAVARGVKSGAAYFLERLSHRHNNGRSATHEGDEHERESAGS